MSAKYKSPSFLLPNELNTNTNPLNTDSNPATGTGVNSLYSMDFDSSNSDYIDIGATPNTGDISISFWVKHSTGGTCAIASGDGVFEYLRFMTESKISLYIANQKYYLTTDIKDGNWHHVAVTNDTSANEIKGYTDGSLTQTHSLSVSSNNVKTIGVYKNKSLWFFNGQLDEVAIFNKVLNTTEIAALYDGTGSNIRPSNLIASNLNPVAYYPLGEQAQNSGYLSATGNEWQFPNGVLQDYVMDFDGATVGDYIDAGDIPLEGVYTISFWINPDVSPSSLYFLLDKGDGSSNISVRVTQSSNNTIRFQIGSSNFSSTDTLTNNSWNNVILIANGSSSKIYINNGTAATGTLTTAPNTTQSLLIGTDQGKQSTYYFNGQMSNVVVWNTDQSANVANIYNNGSPQTTYTVAPQNWWKLNADSVYTPSAPNYTTALDFNGSSDYISLSNNTLINTTSPFSISGWFNLDSIDSGGYSAAFALKTNSNHSFVAYISNQGGYAGVAFGEAESGSAINTSTNVSSLFINKWANLTITYNGSGIGSSSNYNLYINGQAQTLTSNNGFSGYGNVNLLGYYSNTGFSNGFNGSISNAAIFNSALTSSQVSTLFNFGTPETNISFSPQAWWKLNDQTAITDSSGNGNTGTNNGATDAPGGVAVTPSWKIPSALPIPTINYTTAGSFNGTSSKIVTTEENLGTTNTISFWHKRPTGMGSNKVVIGGNTLNRFDGTIILNSYQLAIGFQTDKALYFIDNIFSAGVNASGVSIPYEDVWVHYCITRNGTTQSDIKLYLNSYLVTSSKSEPFGAVDYTTNTTILNLGAASAQSIYSEGELSNISTFSSAFTQAQVNTLYNNGQPSADISSLSPVNWWKLDTIGATITDNGSAGNNGTNTDVTAATTDVKTSDLNIPVNGVSTTLPSTALQQSDLQFDSPYSNYSLYFDGASSRVQALYNLPSGVTKFSVSIWANVEGAGSSVNKCLISNENSNSADGYALFTEGTYPNTKVSFKIENNTSTQTTSNIVFGEWFHVLATYDNGTAKIYFNGVLEDTTTGVPAINTSSLVSTMIGSYRESNPIIPMLGHLDEAAIWETVALTDAQVLQTYNNGKPNDISSLSPTNWWRLGENAYFNNGNKIVTPNSIIGGVNGIGSGTVNDSLSANAPGTYANGVGTNLDIVDRVGDAPLSVANSQSYNMIPDDKIPYVPGYVGDQIANNFSMSFSGVLDYISLGNPNNLQITGAISLSFWFNSTASTSGFITKSDNGSYFSSNSSKVYEIGILSNQLYWQIGDGTNVSSLPAAFSSYLDGNWHHVVATWDGTTNASSQMLFVDGLKIGSRQSTISAIQNKSNNVIISSQSSAYDYVGKLDEVAIFDTALNAGQIYNDIYQPTATGTNQTADLVNNPNLPNPVAWYRMGD